MVPHDLKKHHVPPLLECLVLLQLTGCAVNARVRRANSDIFEILHIQLILQTVTDPAASMCGHAFTNVPQEKIPLCNNIVSVSVLCVCSQFLRLDYSIIELDLNEQCSMEFVDLRSAINIGQQTHLHYSYTQIFQCIECGVCVLQIKMCDQKMDCFRRLNLTDFF